MGFFFFMCCVCLLHIVCQVRPCVSVGGGKKGITSSNESLDSFSWQTWEHMKCLLPTKGVHKFLSWCVCNFLATFSRAWCYWNLKLWISIIARILQHLWPTINMELYPTVIMVTRHFSNLSKLERKKNLL